MKRILLYLLLTTAFAGLSNRSFAQETTGPKIKFEKEVHDYGEIAKGSNGKCYFKFKNTGTEPLIITNARTSCGCMVSEWPKDPIAPGQEGVISVWYDTSRIGPINKSVTVDCNDPQNPTMLLRVRGTVIAPAGGESPVNSLGAPAND